MNVYKYLCWYDERNPNGYKDRDLKPRQDECSCDNCFYGYDQLAMEIIRCRAALTRLRDCDWVISLPDRMDAVRDIARNALSEAPE